MPELYTIFPTPFGELSLVWIEVKPKLVIQQLFLSNPKLSPRIQIRSTFPSAKPSKPTEITQIVGAIQQFLAGRPVDFDLKYLNWQRCSILQKRILLAEASIPRGWVSTYQRIAQHVGIRKGARVVGNALARNPFPLFIPCHRAIKSDGSLGGYQGGVAMKRRLLEFEGVQFMSRDKVSMDKVFF
ncbi:MAG: methylated-DNA--[protein]-cysteine S-methyltransferase [Promethearchaeota archaeon]